MTRKVYESQRKSWRSNARAVARAKQKLVERHRDEYQELLEVEKAREGIRTLQIREVPK